MEIYRSAPRTFLPQQSPLALKLMGHLWIAVTSCWALFSHFLHGGSESFPLSEGRCRQVCRGAAWGGRAAIFLCQSRRLCGTFQWPGVLVCGAGLLHIQNKCFTTEPQSSTTAGSLSSRQSWGVLRLKDNLAFYLL